MLDRKEIDIEIARLEYGDSSYPAYAKLADLYTIRDRMDRQEHQATYEGLHFAAPASVDFPPVEDYGDSDFLRTVYGKDQASAWGIMDDLMDTLHTVTLVCRRGRNAENAGVISIGSQFIFGEPNTFCTYLS